MLVVCAARRLASSLFSSFGRFSNLRLPALSSIGMSEAAGVEK